MSDHYRKHPSGIETRQITDYCGFNLGNIIKYAMRCDIKNNGEDAIADLRKIIDYANFEIEKRTGKKGEGE